MCGSTALNVASLTFAIIFLLLCSGCTAQQRRDGISALCDSEADNCSTCYRRLVCEAITPEMNQFNMQKAFFPADTSNPVYIVVRYSFPGFEDRVFYWSESTYFSLFRPLPVFQYTSLFFGDFDFRRSTLNLTLEADCADVPESNLQFLTQRVSNYNYIIITNVKKLIYP